MIFIIFQKFCEIEVKKKINLVYISIYITNIHNTDFELSSLLCLRDIADFNTRQF
jgi:hypothetical protein